MIFSNSKSCKLNLQLLLLLKIMEIETYESYMVHFETDLNMIRSNLADLNLVTEERINYITDFQKNLTLIA